MILRATTPASWLAATRAMTRRLAPMALGLAVPLSLAACGDSSTNSAKQPAGGPAPSAKDTASRDGDPNVVRDGDSAPAAPDATPTPTEPAAASAGPRLPDGMMLMRRPLGAVGVAGARVGVRPGEPISVIGRIGGSRSPVVSNRAVFTIVDPEMKCCLETSDQDHCPRPWDYCCSDRSQLAAATATIEICGPDGKPLPLSLEQEGTLKPLTLVAVNGVLETPDGSGSFVIRARGIYLMPDDPLADRISAFRK